MATATATGNIFLWDLNYDRNMKSRSLLGSYQSACQGLSWNNKDTNLLLSCFQEGVILLWVQLSLALSLLGSSARAVCFQVVLKQLLLGGLLREVRSIPPESLLLHS